MTVDSDPPIVTHPFETDDAAHPELAAWRARMDQANTWGACQSLKEAVCLATPEELGPAEAAALQSEIAARLTRPVVGTYADWNSLCEEKQREIWDLHEYIHGRLQPKTSLADRRQNALDDIACLWKVPASIKQGLRDLVAEHLPADVCSPLQSGESRGIESAALPQTPPAPTGDGTADAPCYCDDIDSPRHEFEPCNAPDDGDLMQFPVDDDADSDVLTGSAEERTAPQSESEPTAPAPHNGAPYRGVVKVWADHVRALPSPFARSALFVPTKSPRLVLKRLTPLDSLSGIEIHGKGVRPTQSDMDVWCGALHLARRHPFGTIHRATFVEFLRAAGQVDGTRTRHGACRALRRLASFTIRLKVTVEGTSHTYEGPLLTHVETSRAKASSTHDVQFCIPPGLAFAFHPEPTYYDLKDRRAVAGRPLAGWLFIFAASHRQPLEMFVSTYHRLTGLGGLQSTFRRLATTALAVLQSKGLVEEAEVTTGDKVRVVNKPRARKK